MPVVSGEDRAARGRPTEDPHLSRARRGLAAGERWQPAAVLLSAAARGGQARPSAPRRRRAPRSASRAAQPGDQELRTMLHETRDRQKFVSDVQYLRDMQHKVDSEYQACLKRQENKKEPNEKK